MAEGTFPVIMLLESVSVKKYAISSNLVLLNYDKHYRFTKANKRNGFLNLTKSLQEMEL